MKGKIIKLTILTKYNNMKYVYKEVLLGVAFILLMIMSSFFVLAEVQTLGVFKQNEAINLKQTCADCTYVNISEVIYPDSTIALSQVAMTPNAGGVYTYSFTNTSKLGQYIVTTCGDVGGTKTCVGYDFDITPSGESSMLGFYIIAIVLCYGLLIFGVYKQDALFGGLGSLALYILGIYIYYYGVDTFRNYLTDAFAAVTIGIAIYGTIQSLKEIGEI